MSVGFECPYCGATNAKGKGGRPRTEDKSRFVAIHWYRCLECEKDFSTEERPAEPLANVRINNRPFNRDKLEQSIARFAPKRLTNEECREVTARATAAIAAQLREGRTSDGLSRDGEGHVKVARDVVSDRTLDAFVEVARRHRETGARPHEMYAAHIQYALATKGSSWLSALDFLKWYKAQDYASGTPRLEVYSPSRSRNTVAWVTPPTLPPTEIKIVVKNSFGASVREPKATRHREHQAFDPKKLRSSIDLALRGRAALAQADRVEAYVRWALAGQTIVRSSQISTLVSETLRSVDDIAYLRWVMIGKELSATTVYDEALGLVEHPSPILDFKADDPRVLRAAQANVGHVEASEDVVSSPR